MSGRQLPTGLTRRGAGYVVQWFDGSGWRRSRVGNDLTRALEEHARLRVPRPRAPKPRREPRPALVEGAPKGPPRVRLTDLRDAWLVDQKLRNRERTVASARNRIERVVEMLGSEKYVDDITSADLARIIERRRRQRVSDVTINGHITLLRAMLRWGVNEGLIQKLPVRLKLLRVVEKKRLEIFEPDQIDEVIENAEPRVRLLVLLVAATGMRRDEALHLRWCDVDFEDARVDLRAKRFNVRMRDRTVVEKTWRPKTSEERELYLPDSVVRELRRFRMKQKYSGDSDWVFQSTRRRGQRWANPAKMVRLAFMDADIYEKGKLLHAIRHTVASRLVRAVDIECARATLGHRSILTTQRYLHSDGVQRRKAANAIGLVGRKGR